MTKGKIVLIPFPFDDLSAVKVRPVVCLTNPISKHAHVIVAFITSRVLNEPLNTDIIIQPNDPDFAITGLHIASTIQLHRLTTINCSLIQRELGKTSDNLESMIINKLMTLFNTQ